VVPNPTHGMILTDIDHLRGADITYMRLMEKFAYLRSSSTHSAAV
jgi:hypothetical protein